VKISLYGNGQVCGNVARILSSRTGFDVSGPFGRADRDAALGSGADIVVVATTSFLRDVGPDIRRAVEAGSNVLTTAEEAAYPWHFDDGLARDLDALARARNVSILGAGLNPGFAFDALVLTCSGVLPEVRSIRVERVVNLSGFSETILRRLGLGFSAEDFKARVADDSITGHIGFPQSMRIVTRSLGLHLEKIDKTIEPIIAESPFEGRQLRVDAGRSAGFTQRYVGYVGGAPFFEAFFFGHLDPDRIGEPTRDEITLNRDEPPGFHMIVQPGMNPQVGASSVVANSLRRLAAAAPGWLTVADLPPASPGDPR
jgi:4-hydroxy-tetrahydrodipicolinate reductase